jgi:hypothetical protein
MWCGEGWGGAGADVGEVVWDGGGIGWGSGEIKERARGGKREGGVCVCVGGGVMPG